MRKQKTLKELGGNVTYDDTGKPMKVGQVKVEKLPNLQGAKPGY